MTTCENPPTHQTAESHVPLCREHASQAKREGNLVEIRPSPGTGRRNQPSACQYVEPEETAAELEPELNESEDS